MTAIKNDVILSFGIFAIHMIEIKPVIHSSDWSAFHRFPLTLYKNHPYYIPAFVADDIAFFSDANPSMKHSEFACFLAYKNQVVVGRIAVMINRKEWEFIGEKQARFGWVDFENDKKISSALFSAAEKWATQRDCTKLKGPNGLVNLDRSGALTDGFDVLGCSTAIYNYPYYIDHFASLGYTEDLTWIENYIPQTPQIPEKLLRMTQLIMNRYELQRKRYQSTSELLEAIPVFIEVFEEAHRHLPTFAPMTKEEMSHYAKRFLSVLRLDFCSFIADKNGTLIGFGITIPSMSRALQKSKGKIWPFGWHHLRRALRHPDTAELLLIGVRDQHRNQGIHALIFQDVICAYHKAGVQKVLINPILEQNASMLNTFSPYGIIQYRTRSTFIKSIT